MPNYKETTQLGDVKTWRALRQGFADNPFNGVPVFSAYEVERTTLDGVLIREQSTGRTLTMVGSDPNLKIPYINPETYEQILDVNGDPIAGQYFTAEQFIFFIACIYIAAAKNEDARELSVLQDEPPLEPPEQP